MKTITNEEEEKIIDLFTDFIEYEIRDDMENTISSVLNILKITLSKERLHALKLKMLKM